MKKETVTKTDLFELLDIFEELEIAYWVEGGWGVDILTGKQNRVHRDLDIDFDAAKTELLLAELSKRGFIVEIDLLPVRMELWHSELGYLDIHPLLFQANGGAKQANPEGGFFEFSAEWYTRVSFEGREIPCYSKEAQQLFHSGYELRDIDHTDLENLALAD